MRADDGLVTGWPQANVGVRCLHAHVLVTIFIMHTKHVANVYELVTLDVCNQRKWTARQIDSWLVPVCNTATLSMHMNEVANGSFVHNSPFVAPHVFLQRICPPISYLITSAPPAKVVQHGACRILLTDIERALLRCESFVLRVRVCIEQRECELDTNDRADTALHPLDVGRQVALIALRQQQTPLLCAVHELTRADVER